MRTATAATVDTVTLHGSSVSAQVRPVPHQPTTAQLTLLGQHAPPSDGDVARWLASLTDHGYRRVRTGALNAAARRVFDRHGFVVAQELALLEHTHPAWRHPPRRPTAGRLRSIRPTDLTAAADVDTAAFGVAWGMDDAALQDICRATPEARARLVEVDGHVVATAISGRDRELGFLQRLAVHPDHQRRGHGDALVADAMRWMARRRVRRVLVNTHVANDAALALYHRHGFAVLAERLDVCERAVP